METSSGVSGRAGERGQGLTEYLIIIALIAIAAIGVYSFFGQSAVRQPEGGAREEASGKAVAKDAARAPSAASKAPAKPADPKGEGDAKGAATGK